MTVVSLEPDVLQLADRTGDPVLLASRCTQCGQTFFPQRAWCGGCAEPSTEVVELPREGQLTSYARVHRKPEYSAIEAPYVLGEVTLCDGVRIYSVVTGLDDGEAEPGTPVRLSTLPVRTGDDGATVLGYAFQVKEG
jgi:hypothetical protein